MPEDSSNVSPAAAQKEFEDALRELQEAKAEEERAIQKNLEVKAQHEEIDRKTHTLQKNILAITLKDKHISASLDEGGEKVTPLSLAIKNNINPALNLLKEKKKDDPVLESFYETYISFADLYSASLEKGAIPSDPAKVHAMAGAVVAMQTVLAQARAYIQNKENGIQVSAQSGPEVLSELQKTSYLGIDEKELKGLAAIPAERQKLKDTISDRATKLFGNEKSPGLYRRIINVNQYLPEDSQLLALRDFSKQQAERYKQALVEMPKNQWRNPSVPQFEISNDPAMIGQAQDAVTWMELAAGTLERYAKPGTQVAAYLQDKLKPVDTTVAQTESSTTSILSKTDPSIPKKSPERTPDVRQKSSDTVKTNPSGSTKASKNIETQTTLETQPTLTLTPAQIEAAEWIVANGKSIMGDDGLTDDDLGMDENKKPRASEEMLAMFIDHSNTLGDIGASLKQGEEISSLQKIINAQKQPQAVADDMPVKEEIIKSRTTTQTGDVNLSVPKSIPAASADVQKPARVETPVSGLIRVRNGGQVQFIEQNGVNSPSYTLDTRYGMTLSVGRYGMASFDQSTGEWIMQTPSGVREVRGAIRSIPDVPTDPVLKAQVEVIKNNVAEYFQRAGGIDRLNSRILKMFEQYDVLMTDKKECGGSVKWQTYAQEAKQLSSRYLLTLSNGSFPTDERNRIALLTVASEFEQLLADYEQDRESLKGNPPAEEDGPWKDEALQKLSPNERLKHFSEKYAEWTKEYGSAEGKANQIWKEFDAEYKPYYNIYERTAAKKPVDMRMIAVVLTQMERLLHYYGLKLQTAKETEQKPTEKGSAKGLFGGFLNKASAVVGGVVQQSSNDPELQKRVLEEIFRPGQPRFEIRENLITGSMLKPLPQLSEKEKESLLYLRAHLPDFAGNDGRLNSNDVAAVVDQIYRDVMARPHDLHKTILKEKNIPQGSYEDVGLQKALGLVSEMTEQEASQFNQGINAENRPLMGWLFRTFRSDDYCRLQQAKMQLGQLYAVRAQIPMEVRAKIDEQLKSFIQKAHLPSYAVKHDTGHGRLSEADMREFERHAGVLKAVSERALKDVRERTGASIETYLPEGLSVEFIDWMLDAQTRPDGRKGIAPGSVFWIEGAPVSRTVGRGAIASKKTVTENTDVSVDLGSPSIELGEPSVDLGEPTSMLGKPVPVESSKTVVSPAPLKQKTPEPQLEEELITPFSVVESEPETQSEKIKPVEKTISMPEVSINQQQREIRLPVTDRFTITYNPNPNNLTPTHLTPERVQSLDGIALKAFRDNNLWVLQIRPGFEQSVIVTRDSDGSAISLESTRQRQNVATVVKSEQLPKNTEAAAEMQEGPKTGMINITSFKQLHEIVSSPNNKKRILIEFGAKWCGPCQQMETPLKNLKKDHLILAVDFDQNPDIANAYGIESLPTFVIVQNSKILKRTMGITGESDLRSSLRDPNEENSANSRISSATPPRPE